MKICIISPLYDPWLVGGAEKYITTLSKQLAKQHSVVVITTIGNMPRHSDLRNNNPKIIEINTKNICSPYEIISQPSMSKIKKALWHSLDNWNLSVFMTVFKLLKQERPDIVHTNGVKGLSASIFSAIKQSGRPHIHTAHDYELISKWSSLYRNGKPITNFNLLDSIYKFYMKKVSSTIEVIISPSKFLLDLHVSHGFFKNASKYVVPNGIDQKQASAPKQYSREFLCLGQLVEHKGVQIAIDAFKELEVPDARLHIIGDGPYLQQLKCRAKTDNRILFYGYVNDQQKLNEIMAKCSYFIFPSIWFETFGLVINEVMSRGFPVIASRIGGIPELVKDGFNGYLVEPNDVAQLKSLLNYVIQNRGLINDLSNHAIESSKAFPISGHVEKLLQIYESQVKV